MLANIFIIVFLIGMAYWWALQGFFSAFIHLCLTIAAATIALSVWEPLVLKFLIYRMPYYAWTVGLLGPFALILILFRGAADRLVPGNVHFQPIIGRILGAFCGLFSAILTSGLVVIALGFLPFGPSLGGYQPYALASGRIANPDGGGLWVGVDTMAESFLAMIAGGSFYPWSGTPLGLYQPDLAAEATQIRLREDEHGSIVAVPGAVVVDEIYSPAAAEVEKLSDSTKLLLAEGIKDATDQLVVVSTIWKKDLPNRGTYDSDDTARIPPSHVRLVTHRRARGKIEIQKHTPIAVTKKVGERRNYFSFAKHPTAHSINNNDKLAWVYIIEADQKPQYLSLRHLRLELPGEASWKSEVADLAVVLGEGQTAKVAEVPNGDSKNGKNGKTPEGSQGLPQNILVSNRLIKAFSKNAASQLKYQDNSVAEGCARIRHLANQRLSKNNRIDAIYCPSHLGMVRLQIDTRRAQGLLGVRSDVKSLGGIFLIDSGRERHAPMAFHWQPKNGEEKVCITPIRSARDLPVPEMKEGDHLFVFFRLPTNIRIVSYQIGADTFEDGVDFKVTAAPPRRK